MRPILIYFRETHLDKNNKFTLDFSDRELVQEEVLKVEQNI